MGLFTALAIAIHNFPEGLATFLTALHDPGLGVAIAIAIALHNIPEGISCRVAFDTETWTEPPHNELFVPQNEYLGISNVVCFFFYILCVLTFFSE